VFGKIIPHKDFQNYNDAQLAWLQMQIELDDVEKYELLRDIAEHNAMFLNPEGVKQVREARDRTYETPAEDFENMIEEMFGRKLPSAEGNKNGGIEELKKIFEPAGKPIDYLDIELDEVSFTPFE
jgi:hypothetical protein